MAKKNNCKSIVKNTGKQCSKSIYKKGYCKYHYKKSINKIQIALGVICSIILIYIFPILGGITDSKRIIDDMKKSGRNYSISEQDDNVRGILIPPDKFSNSSVYLDLGGGKGAFYKYETLKNGSPGQPETYEGYEGIHVLTYDSKDIKYGSILSLHIDDDNYLKVSAKFYNSEGKLVGALKNNEFINIRKNQISWNYDEKGFEVIDDDLNVNLLVDFKENDTLIIRGILGWIDGFFALTDNSMISIKRTDSNFKEGIK